MVGEATIEIVNHKISLRGFLIFETVLPIYQLGIDYISQHHLPELEINLSQIEKSDSSGLSILLGWMREAKKKNMRLYFTHVPRYLLDIARVCGIETILPIIYI